MELLVEERERVTAPTAATYTPLVMVSVAALAVFNGDLRALLSPHSALDPGVFALPRSYPALDESLDLAAGRELARLCGAAGYYEQLYTWTEIASEGRPGPGSAEERRVLEVSYLAPCIATTVSSVEPRSGAGSVSWTSLLQLPRMAPGHAEILGYAHRRLSRKLSYTNIAVNLLPAEFALSELQAVYEVIRGRPLDKRNFRKWIFATGFVEATPHERRFGAHRPARLYRFVSRDLLRID